ncbi:type II secretion system protein [Sphaerisporangium sp. NPDC088356]|uniref:type II secretion system protein n=1 Tax=Sphaerisporangium sp. NPDC088356 TaxID=3154871 RepID=UPI00343B5DCF
MTGPLIGGGIVGLGVFLLLRALFPTRPGLAARLLAADAVRRNGERAGAVTTEDATGPFGREIGTFGGESGRFGREAGTFGGETRALRREAGEVAARFYAARGWELRAVRADLALLGRSFEDHLAGKYLLGAAGLLAAPILAAWIPLMGWDFELAVPLSSAAVLALIFFMLPDLRLRREATVRRREFRRVLGAFLDLVAMNLAGGGAVPEALMTASSLADGWAMWRIRDALVNARFAGITPWQALGRLGEEVDVDELRDLSSSLGLAVEDGVRVRQVLADRAGSVRRRRLAEVEGRAGERSQSMLVAQVLLCAGFALFLSFPAAMKMLGS